MTIQSVDQFSKTLSDIFPYWYTIKAIFLITLRWWLYRKDKYHYFLYDFCYFGNFLTLLYVLFFPHSRALFLVVFAFANGPLAWAVGRSTSSQFKRILFSFSKSELN
jgi:hypothetical protein